MKTILVPTDFSDVSENAANYAAELAKCSKAKLILLHTYSLMGPLIENPATDFQFEEIGRVNDELLMAFDARLKAAHGNIETELISTVGFLLEEVILTSEQRKADLVVMGIAGNGKAESILGSNTISVIKESRCPVLTIPENVRFRRPKKIALACDYTSILPAEVIDQFKSFVRLFNSKVLVFDVLKKAELVSYEKVMVEENLADSLSEIDHSLYFPSGDDLTSEINSFVDIHKADLIAMIPHKHNFISSMLHHSNTKEMAINTHIPLLTIHE